MDSLYNNIQAYFHIIDMNTDNDILGFKALSKTVYIDVAIVGIKYINVFFFNIF